MSIPVHFIDGNTQVSYKRSAKIEKQIMLKFETAWDNVRIGQFRLRSGNGREKNRQGQRKVREFSLSPEKMSFSRNVKGN